MANRRKSRNPENRPNIVLTLKKHRKGNDVSHDETITGLSSVQAAEALARQHGLYDDIYIITNGKTGQKICAGRVGRTMNQGKNAGLRYLESEEQMNQRGFKQAAAKLEADPKNQKEYKKFLKDRGTTSDSISYAMYLKNFK